MRRALALMPTAQQSPASVAAGRSSPFSFNDRNHFVRFAVIDAVAYNGRDASDGLVQAIRRPDMNKLQPVRPAGVGVSAVRCGVRRTERP